MWLLHGEDISASRKRLVELVAQAKEGGKEVFELNASNLSLTSLKQSFESGSLFGTEKFIIIEGLPGQKEELEYLQTNQEKDIVLWVGKKITPAQAKLFVRAKAQEFKLPQLLFTFLDGIGVRGKNELLKLLFSLLEQQNPDMVLALYHRRVRHMMLCKMRADAALKAERIVGWQLGKLISQTKNVDLEKITDEYRKCFQYDLNRKSGKTFFSTEQFLQTQIGQW